MREECLDVREVDGPWRWRFALFPTRVGSHVVWLRAYNSRLVRVESRRMVEVSRDAPYRASLPWHDHYYERRLIGATWTGTHVKTIFED